MYPCTRLIPVIRGWASGAVGQTSLHSSFHLAISLEPLVNGSTNQSTLGITNLFCCILSIPAICLLFRRSGKGQSSKTTSYHVSSIIEITHYTTVSQMPVHHREQKQSMKSSEFTIAQESHQCTYTYQRTKAMHGKVQSSKFHTVSEVHSSPQNHLACNSTTIHKEVKHGMESSGLQKLINSTNAK